MSKSKKKKVKVSEKPKGIKEARNTENPESYYDKTPKWVFKDMDVDHEKWSLQKCNNIYPYIIEKMKDYEGMTWGEIMKATGGRRTGNNNHFENVDEFIKEAQERWIELKLEEYSEAFSLRLTGTHRLYGILEDGTFRVILYDEDHEIYKSTKRHT